jgi:ubiquinone/menaquinone biosynthesis C-methylase UbiE
MIENSRRRIDFDNPPWPFVLEDKLKRLLGGLLIYGPYVRSLGLGSGGRVLDFGCGGATEALSLLEAVGHAGRVTCVDTSKYWIDKARKRLAGIPNAECLHGDIRRLELPDDSFDASIAIHVIHDIPPDIRADTVAAVVRKLKPRGAFFVWEPLKKSHGMAVDDLRRLLAEAGVHEISSETGKKSFKGKFEKAG